MPPLPSAGSAALMTGSKWKQRPTCRVLCVVPDEVHCCLIIGPRTALIHCGENRSRAKYTHTQVMDGISMRAQRNNRIRDKVRKNTYKRTGGNAQTDTFPNCYAELREVIPLVLLLLLQLLSFVMRMVMFSFLLTNCLVPQNEG